MLNVLESLQNGTVDPPTFIRTQIAHRLANLELRKTEDNCNHTGSVNTMDIDRVDDRYLLAGTNNGMIYLHDLQNSPGESSYSCRSCGDLQGTGHSHFYSVDTVQWYPFDTGIFTSSGMDCQLKVWDTGIFKPVDSIQLPGMIFSHHMSTIATHHSLIAVGMQLPQAVLIDLRTGSQCHQLSGHKVRVMSVKWSPFSPHLLATGGADNKLLLWDVRSAKGFLKALDQHNGEALTSKKDHVSAHNGLINSLRFSSDGMYLLSFGTDDNLRLWDVALGKNTLVNYGKISNMNRKCVQIDICDDSVEPVVFLPSRSRILMYEIFTGEKCNTFVGHMSATRCCAFRNQFHELYTSGNDRQILTWTPDAGLDELLGQERRATDPRLRDAWSDDDS